MDYNNKSYIILATSELDKINFYEVLETSADTVKRSIDGSKTFVKYFDTMPPSVASLTTKEGPYTNEQMLTILQTSEWLKLPEWYTPGKSI
jgi:hypothetical protein